MPIQIGRAADHGYDEPLGLLSDCHRRIEYFLGVLATATEEARGGPLTASYRNALEEATRYFAVAAPKHTADEEVSLFPRMRTSGDPAVAEALASLETLEHDHDEAEKHHAAVDRLVRQWLASDQLPAAATGQLRQHLTRLQTLYQRHIAIEDHQVFPAAARVLGRDQIAEIGAEMAARRRLRVTSPDER